MKYTECIRDIEYGMYKRRGSGIVVWGLERVVR